MPSPIPTVKRRRIQILTQRGATAAAIARELQLSPRTVRHLCRQFQKEGAKALAPAYVPAEPATPTESIRRALFLHEEHPSWGAPYLLIRLRQMHRDLEDLPSVRTLQRWMHRQRQPPAPPGRKPTSTRITAQRPHEVWQMDAVEQLRLANGQQVSWLRWVDEFTGAVLGTVVFPPGDLRRSARARCTRCRAKTLAVLGYARDAACGQRHALGQLERPAHAVRALGRGRRRPLALERARSSATKPEDRAVSRNRQTLERTAYLREHGRTAASSG